jgi:hypothetical protein
MKMMTQSKKLKARLKEFNQLINQKPLVLNGASPKYVSYGGTWGVSYETLGVKADIIRIYNNYKLGRNFAISFKTTGSELEVNISTQKILPNQDREDGNYKYQNPNYEKEQDLVTSLTLTYDEFRIELNQLLKELKEDKDKCNLNYVMCYFNQSEILI